MSTRITITVSLLLALPLNQPARAADKLSAHSLGSRLAEKPSGAAAEALAQEIRIWFGKDRAGNLNVANGANPRVEGLDSAWAIEAPARKRSRS